MSLELDRSSALLPNIFRPIMCQENSRSMASSGKMKERPPQTTSLNRKHSLNMIRSSALPPPRVTQLLHVILRSDGLHRSASDLHRVVCSAIQTRAACWPDRTRSRQAVTMIETILTPQLYHQKLTTLA